MSAEMQNRPRVVVVGSGAGGAAAAKELQHSADVTIIEAGREFRPLSLSVRRMERLRNLGLLFDPRVVGTIFPAMRVRRMRDRMLLVHGKAVGGTTLLSTGNALRMDGDLAALGIDLDPEFTELSKEVPVSTAHRTMWSPVTQRLFDASRQLGLNPEPTPKFIDFDRCRGCGRCVLGCPFGAKWDSRTFLREALADGAQLHSGWRVTRIVVRAGRAVGVTARAGVRTRFFPADLVVVAAGGIGTPALLRRSGIRCMSSLFTDPVLCVAAPWPQSSQHREVQMPFVIQRGGYMISPYFDYLSFLFNRGWRRPADRVIGLMIKLADSEEGSVSRGRIEKGLSDRDRRRLGEAEALCRSILGKLGVDPASIFTGTINAGHPGGTVPLSAGDARTLHPSFLPDNLYVADASLLPRSLGNPPILTILALARRVARAAVDSLAGAFRTGETEFRSTPPPGSPSPEAAGRGR